MLIILTSPSVVAPDGQADPRVVDALMKLATAGTPVGVISNHSQPSWFSTSFPKDAVSFIQSQGRQSGSHISDVCQKYNVPLHDLIVLGANDDDIKMAKNAGGVFVSAGWRPDTRAAQYGVSVTSPSEFVQVVQLVERWPGLWYYEGREEWYSVRALADVSGKNVTAAQTHWAQRVVATVKGGGSGLPALLTIGARSLLKSGIVSEDQGPLMFGLYPSSGSSNDDDNVLTDFMHRLRTVTSRVRFAKKGEPLFLRHSPSTKRSRSNSLLDRTNPAEQVQTLHLNPEYESRISGRHIILLDDCTTYGVSFGVASSFLRKAGASAVDCIALGKFGDQLRYYELSINSDPFKPVSAEQYKVSRQCIFRGTCNANAQMALRGLI